MDTKWQLDGLISNEAVSSVPSGLTSNLIFDKDGQIQGNFGCNSGGGDYDVQGHVITFGPIASTLMACARDGRQVEGSVLQVLTGSADYSIDGSVLSLTNGDVGLTYRSS